MSAEHTAFEAHLDAEEEARYQRYVATVLAERDARLAARQTDVVCEPCKSGRSLTDCVRPCTRPKTLAEAR